MALRNTQTLTFRPNGVTDSIDGTNAEPGSMSLMSDMIPNPSTRNQAVPRPASVQISNCGAYASPPKGSALVVIGTKAYGFIASARFAGKDEPFCFDLVAGAFVTLSNVTGANCPTTQPATGDWEPPTVAGITQSKVLLTHPGYDGVTNFFGWIDLSSFSYTGAATGNTHTSKTIDNLSASAITLGWQVGFQISDSAGDIPANTFITNISADGMTVTISNAATGSNAGVTFTVTGGSVAAPLYGAGNTAPAPLVQRPVAVGQFNSRAYFCVQNGVAWSDSVLPVQRSLSTQAVTLGDNIATTALGGLPLTSQLTGGIIQALVVFKGGGPYWQITGDPATNNLVVSEVAGSMGTRAPNTIVSTPAGLAFVAQDGMRIIPPTGVATEPIGNNGQGVCIPFVNAIHPSRMCAAYNHSVIRISVQNGAAQGQPVQEWWYDLNLKIWTGPHSFPATVISAYDGVDDTFVLFPNYINVPAGAPLLDSHGEPLLDASGQIITTEAPQGLWQSDVAPSLSSTYVENGSTLMGVMQTTLFPDNEAMAGNSVVEASLGMTIPATEIISILVTDELGNQLDLLALSGPNAGSSVWGGFTWGSAPWGGSVVSYQQYRLPWHQPLVFKQALVRITTQSMLGLVVGNLYVRYEVLGYMLK